MKITNTNPDEFIDNLPNNIKGDIEELDKIISKLIPEKRVMYEGKFWGGSEQKIIGYGEFSYVNSSKKEIKWFLVGLANQKRYITVYVNAVEDRKYLAEMYKDKLGKVKVGKSSISFKSLDELNIDTLKELLSKAYKLSKK